MCVEGRRYSYGMRHKKVTVLRLYNGYEYGCTVPNMGIVQVWERTYFANVYWRGTAAGVLCQTDGDSKRQKVSGPRRTWTSTGTGVGQ